MYVTPLESRPEAMADVPGVCELTLTRAVVHYRDVHEIEGAGGRIQDIGLGLVLDGRYASTARVADLGSAEVKQLDLSSELVVLDWVYEPTLAHVRGLLAQVDEEGGPGATAGRRRAASYCFDLALRVFRRVGYGPLTRRCLLRVGFRDICRDLDLHEGTSVRLTLGGGRTARARLDYDGNALEVSAPSPAGETGLEAALRQAFPGRDVRILPRPPESVVATYQVRFPLPLSLSEARGVLREVRAGLAHLLAVFEPAQSRTVQALLRTFGVRDTLARLEAGGPDVHAVPLGAVDGTAAPFIH